MLNTTVWGAMRGIALGLAALLSLLALPLTLSAHPATVDDPLFTVQGGGPIVAHGATDAWDGTYTDPGAQVFYNGQFHMFRNGFRAWPAPVQIGYVTSDDGTHWTKQGDQPVLTSAEVPYAKVAALASSVLVENGTWILYFYTWQDYSTPSPGGAIGRATAPSPTGPWTVDPAPVLTPGPAGAWDAVQVASPSVVHAADGYRMYFTGYDAGGTWQIGLATSPDGSHWTKYDDPATIAPALATSDPVLIPGPSGAWDSAAVHQPSVQQTPDGWVMLYRTPVRGGHTMALGYALSPDGIRWTRSARNPVLQASAISSAGGFYFTNLLYHEGTYYLFWEVAQGANTDIFLATHPGALPNEPLAAPTALPPVPPTALPPTATPTPLPVSPTPGPPTVTPPLPPALPTTGHPDPSAGLGLLLGVGLLVLILGRRIGRRRPRI